MYTQQRGKKNVPRPAAAVVHGRVISLFLLSPYSLLLLLSSSSFVFRL